MKSRALSLLVVAAALPASAQMRVTLEVPSAPAFRAAPAAVTAFTGASALLAPSLPSALPLAAAPLALAPLAAAPAPLAVAPLAVLPPAAAPALRARPAASVPAARDAAKALSAKLAAAPEASAPALSAAFDGRAAAPSVPVDGTSAAPRTPEDFATRARRLFELLRRDERAAEGSRAGAVATDDELRGRMERLPATNPEREKYMVELFKLAGAKPEDIVLQDAGRGRHNIMVVKKGKTDRVIVVGGHHDKVREGAGSIDNGTGATLVANLYQALHDQETDATIVFIAFAREEEGLIGSQAYLDSLSRAQKSKIDAMVNLDTLAVDGTFSWKNNSTRALLDRVKAVAAATRHDLKEAYLDGGDADSSSFSQEGIPAITLYGASQEVIFDIIHSERDTMAAFDLGHYKNAYLLTLELLKSLDREKLGPVARGGA